MKKTTKQEACLAFIEKYEALWKHLCKDQGIDMDCTIRQCPFDSWTLKDFNEYLVHEQDMFRLVKTDWVERAWSMDIPGEAS